MSGGLALVPGIVGVLAAGCYSGVDQIDDPEGPIGLGEEADGGGGADGEGDGGDSGEEPEAQCRTAGRTAMRLLTAVEYENSVRTLLQRDDLEVRASLPTDEIVGEAYTHNGNAKIDTNELRSYMLVAEQIVADVDVAPLLPCELSGDATDELACAEQIIADFGRRAYRRPLTASEASRWSEVYQASRDEGGELSVGPTEALRTVLTGMLQSPYFLMVSELGEVRDDTPAGMVSLTSHELAAKLAYLIWDDLPDDELAAAADDDRLVDVEVLEQQARRMLEDPRAREGLAPFFEQWLRSDAVLSSSNVSASLGRAMAQETADLVEHVMWGEDADGTLDELLAADYTFVDGELAAHYGLDVELDPGQTQRVSLPPERRGVLGHGSLLAAYGARSASVYRGLHVYRHMLCRPTMPPPDELDTGMFGELDPREAAEARIENPTCSGCHGSFEVVALALENFDGAGRWRETYESGASVDATGIISGDPISGLADLSEVLTGNEEVQRCVALQVSEFAFGQDAQHIPGQDEHCVAETIEDAFVDSAGDLRELAVSLVLSDAFRLRDATSDVTCE